MQIRIARHAGSWYEKQKEALNNELQKYLTKASCQLKNWKTIKAIIAPHAGYAYSGPTAAWAYKYLQTQRSQAQTACKRIFLIGPSHKKYIKGCSISGLDQLQTPLGNLQVDTDEIKKLQTQAKFIKLTKAEEQNEHSLEMHLPYIYKVFGDTAKIIPIIVGETNIKIADQYGKVLAPYFDQSDSIFIISSDFCHWGAHFDYQPSQKGMEIWQFIEQMDKQGINLIEKNDIKGFDNYINQTGNTICGEHPIRILMSTIANSKLGAQTSFVQYAQSQKVKNPNQSSVSYASSVSFLGLQ